jgi:hypothetical protein
MDVEAVEARRQPFDLRAHDHALTLGGQSHDPRFGTAGVDELDLDVLA